MRSPSPSPSFKWEEESPPSDDWDMLEDGIQDVVGDSMPELLLLPPDRDLMSPYSDLVLMVAALVVLLLPLCRWR
jgi:hypothetical protein